MIGSSVVVLLASDLARFSIASNIHHGENGATRIRIHVYLFGSLTGIHGAEPTKLFGTKV